MRYNFVSNVMSKITRSQQERSNLLLKRVDELRATLRKIDPIELARRSDCVFIQTTNAQGELHLPLWGEDIIVTFPELVACDASRRMLNPLLQAMLVYYFYTTDGAALAGRYIAFSELPDGRFYAQAFHGYTGEELRSAFGESENDFNQIATLHGGKHYPLGDAAFSFQMLPRVTLLAVFWRGDEDFPGSYQILFDAAAHHHLPTDACAIAGSLLTRRLISSHDSL